jgi:hypothetical protein
MSKIRPPALPYAISNISSLPYYKFQTTDDRRQLRDAWVFFEDVFAKNLDVAQKRKSGEAIGSYVFTSNSYKTLYDIGKRLHVEIFPEYDWSTPA